jgi:hypothetical protein
MAKAEGRRILPSASPNEGSSLLGGLTLRIGCHLPDSPLLLAGFFGLSSLPKLLRLDRCWPDDQINWLGATVPLLIRSDPNL